MIPRLTVTGTLGLLLPLLAWQVGDGETEAPPATTSTTATTVVPPTMSATNTEPSTTTAATTTTTTTASTTPTTTTTTTIPMSTTTTTTVAPPTTTTAAPATPPPPPTTTTTTTTTSTTTTSTTTTTAPPPPPTPTTTAADPPPSAPPAPPRSHQDAARRSPPDIESAPVGPLWQSVAGRTMAGRGVTESGQARPITFPVAGPVSYVNDFGACRDGCRRQHKGNDIIGDRLQPLLAMRDGVVDRLLDHPTAGYGIVVRDVEGWEYHLYHVNNDMPGSDDGTDDGTWRFAPGVAPGSPVTAGQVIAWMGDSGNSEGSVPHAHVEIRTPDGRAINPFWSLQQAQRDVDCTISTATEPAPAAPAAERDPASLPGDWTPLAISGGRPGSGATVARMWIGPAGFTPIDGAALWVGDARYHEDCSQPVPRPPGVPAELGAILATIRTMESGGDYMAQAIGSSASGAYQFIDASWGGYMGYRRAKDAPPAVQDAKAVELVTAILARNGGDVATIPVTWYIGHVPRGDEWDRVPAVGSNTLTPRQYQQRWLATYARMVGTPEEWVGAAAPWSSIDTSRTCRTVVVDVGTVERPELVLTQTKAFAADPAGRVVVPPADPCDPQRARRCPPASEPTIRVIGPH